MGRQAAWQQRAPSQPILRSLNRLVAGIPLERLTLALAARIEVARNLARALDGMAPGGSGALAQARPSTAREYQEVLDLIVAAVPERDDFMTHLMADENEEP